MITFMLFVLLAVGDGLEVRAVPMETKAACEAAAEQLNAKAGHTVASCEGRA